jgi:serine/threonine-protein kinase RsbW
MVRAEGSTQGGRIPRQGRVNHAVVTLSVPGTVAGVRQAILAFEQFGRAHALPAGAGWRVQLALDEILSNIVRHGGPGAVAPVGVTFSLDGGMVGVEIVDGTAPFNPLLAPAPDTSRPLHERQPGGLGIALVRQLMDETLYERRGHHNYFVMRCGPHADR